MQLLAVTALVFSIVLADPQGRLGDHRAVGSPILRPSFGGAGAPHHSKAWTFSYYVPKVVLRDVETAENFPVELHEVHGALVAAQDAGGVVDHSGVTGVGHFAGRSDSSGCRQRAGTDWSLYAIPKGISLSLARFLSFPPSLTPPCLSFFHSLRRLEDRAE